MRGGPLWLAALGLVPSLARAEPGADPRDPRAMFGLPPDAPATAAAPECTDGRDFGCAVATDPMSDDVPYSLTTHLPAKYLLRLPVGYATHDQLAGYALGAGIDDGGPTFGGATGLENRWTIEGAPADDPLNGGVSTKVPLVFLDGLTVRAGGFAARDRTSTGGTIDAELLRGTSQHELEVYGWASYTAQPTQRPLDPFEYEVRRVQLGPTPNVSAAVVATGPLGHLLGGTAWYAAGIAPSVSDADFEFHAVSEVDDNNDGAPDGSGSTFATHLIADRDVYALTYSIPAMARVGFDAGHQHLELSGIGSDSHNVRFNSSSTVQAGGIDLDSYVLDGIATYHADWPNTRVRVQASWHRDRTHESAHDPAAANIPQSLTTYIPATLSEDPQLATACLDGVPGDRFPQITNCPVPSGFFASGGAGPLLDTTADRPTITADVTQRVGHNVLRAGVTDEDSRVVLRSRFTGLSQLESIEAGEVEVVRYLQPGNDLPCPPDVTQPCTYAESSTLTYRTRSAAAYVEDTWQPMPGMQIDGGLRDEYMQVGDALTFGTQLAPRFGASYDPLGGGRSRIWLSAGRTNVLLPAGLGATILHGNPIAEDVTSAAGQGRLYNLGNPDSVAADIEPTQQDEITLGGEVALLRAVRLTAWGQARWLRRGYDTTPGGFDNPGHDGMVPEATRQSQQVAVQIETAPFAKLALRVGLLYGRATGEWTGAYGPQQGAVLYGGADYDVDATNQYGRLPSDPGTRLYVEAARTTQVGSWQLSAAVRLTAGSGAPRNVLANSADALIELLPRGAAGNLPFETVTNLRLAARWRGTEFTLDIFNLFDHRDPTGDDEVYTSSGVQPISGGTAADLVFLKDVSGNPAVRSSGFQMPNAFEQPFSMTLGAHHAF